MKPNPFDEFIFYDSCAFDGGDLKQQEASLKVQKILESNKVKIILMHSVVSEIKNSKTPEWIRRKEIRSLKTVKLPLTEAEQLTLLDIQNIIVGNGSAERRRADCVHVFEAQKYGGYFVTSDEGIYKHADVIQAKYGLNIVSPDGFLKIVNSNSSNSSSSSKS